MITNETLKQLKLFTDPKIKFTMPKQLKIGKNLDNCFRELDFF